MGLVARTLRPGPVLWIYTLTWVVLVVALWMWR